MNDLPPLEPDAVSAEAILADLESALQRHLDGPPARGGEGDATDDVARLLAALPRMVSRLSPHQVEPCTERLRRIRDLHTRLALRLAQQRQELAERLSRLRKAKPTLRAYSANQ